MTLSAEGGQPLQMAAKARVIVEYAEQVHFFRPSGQKT
jgi:hypothetical protein